MVNTMPGIVESHVCVLLVRIRVPHSCIHTVVSLYPDTSGTTISRLPLMYAYTYRNISHFLLGPWLGAGPRTPDTPQYKQDDGVQHGVLAQSEKLQQPGSEPGANVCRRHSVIITWASDKT